MNIMPSASMSLLKGVYHMSILTIVAGLSMEEHSSKGYCTPVFLNDFEYFLLKK